MRAATLQPVGAPTPETRRFNDALEALLQAAPPPGAVPIEDIRRLRAEGKSVLPVEIMAEGAWREIDSAALGAPGGPNRVRMIEIAAPKGVYLHIHGGGWSLGAAEQYDGRNLRLAKAAGVTVISTHYRLGPEHPWPACADDCFAAARFAIVYAAEAGLPLYIGGESAGGHLAVVTLLRLRDELGKGDAVKGALPNYGCFDLRMTPSMANWGPRNLILSTPIVDWFVANLLPDRSLAADPVVSPLLAGLQGMPPALFQVGDEDPLLDDSTFMAERWRAAGAEAELAIYPGGVHAFDMFDQAPANLPIAREAHANAIAWLRRQLER